MGLFDFILRPFRNHEAAMSSPHGLNQRARVSQETAGGQWGINLITSPTTPEETWRTLDLDGETLGQMSAEQLMKLLPDLSPEISDALYLFLRMCNPGYEITVTWPRSDREHTAGRQALNQFLAQLEQYHGTVGIILGRLFLGQYLKGAALAELVLKDGRTPLDLATPDPITIRFKQVQDGDRGTIYRLGQWQDGRFVPLDLPTIGYIPVDPLFGAPYGRPMVSPAFFSALFLLSLLHDVKRVVMQQGYNRIDIEVKTQELIKNMPSADRSDPVKVKEWVKQAITEVKTMYASLQPDDAYVHTESIELNQPVGTADSDSLKAIDSLIRGLERMAARGLKTMPLLLGSNESVTETHAKYQWALQTAVVRAMQHNVETLLNRLLTLALTAQGIAAVVSIKFASLAPERLNDEKVRQLEIQNAREEYAAGWISQDEAAEKVVGHSADQPEPRQAATAVTQPQEDQNNAMERSHDKETHKSSNGQVHSMPEADGVKVLADL